MPDYWLNIAATVSADYPLPRNPVSESSSTVESLSELYTTECARIEMLDAEYSSELRISIPGAILDRYANYRPTPLFRARRLELALQYTGEIYCKAESANPGGSHKPNTAFAQAYYAAQQGLHGVVTDTGAGQWGTALALAAQSFGLECVVFMTQSSYRDKPYRRAMMELAGAQVHSSPSVLTAKGQQMLDADPDHVGSLGIGMGEAVEYARTKPSYRLALGCMAYHASLHQSIIGLEAELQFAAADIKPDVLVACVGGGSNLIGFAAPYIQGKLLGKDQPRIIAAESSSAPALTHGELRYDFADAFGYTPQYLMYTLGHEFVPPRMHAGGLRYHGKASILSLLVARGLVEAMDVTQESAFTAGRLFYLTEGILPAPESGHAIAAVIELVREAQNTGRTPTIAFCLSGNGFLDLQGYSDQLRLAGSPFK